jgi:DNA-binding beta-propeller fold protein YncE
VNAVQQPIRQYLAAPANWKKPLKFNRRRTMIGRNTRARTHFRRAALLLLAGLLLLVVPVILAQDAAPAAPTAATLTLGKTTTPAGGQDFRLTAVSYQGFWGRGAANTGTYRQPRDVDVDAAGNFYISDHRNSRVTKLNAAGAFVAQIGGPGRGNGQLVRPNAVAVSGNTLAVADTENHRIALFNTNGAFIRNLGSRGTGNGQFEQPNGVAYDAAGNLYVADTWNHRIQVFDANGMFLRQWGVAGSGVGQLRFPAHLDLDAAGNVYVTDSNNHRVLVFNNSGVFIRRIGGLGNAPGLFYLPVGIDVGQDGYVYVSDTYNNRVQKFTLVGAFVAQWNKREGAAILSRPNGLLALGSQVYVSDIDANRVIRYSQGTVLVDHGQQQSLSLPAGTYDVTEAGKAGWTFGNATCNGGNATSIPNGVRLTLTDGGAVTCGFVNNQ